MLDFISDAFRNRGPVGGLFVAVLILLLGAPLFLWPMLQSLEVLQVLPFVLMVSPLLLAIVLHRRRRGIRNDTSGPIHTWPKLGQNDRFAVRSKLTQPVKRK